MSKLGWGTRLMAISALVLSTWILLQVFDTVPYLRAHEVEDLEQYQEAHARDIARELDLDLLRMKSMLLRMAERPEFRHMDIAAQQRSMTQQAEVSPLVNSVFVIDAEGWFVSGSATDLPADATESYADRPLFAVPFERGDVHFTVARFYPETGMVGTSVGVPIQSEGGERVGVLVARLNLQGTIERVKNYPLEALEEDSQVCLNDNEGKVVAHSGMDLFALAEGPLSLDHSELPMVKAIVAGEPGGFQLYEHDGISYFGNYAVLESNGWGVVVSTPMRAIVAEANTLARRVLLVNLGGFAVALVVMVVLTRQVTAERKRAERALRESEELYRTLVETSPDAISLSDLETTILVSNQRSAALLGFETVEEITGKRSADFIAPEDRQRAMDNARRTLEEGIVRGVEYTFVRKDGTRFPGELSASLIVDAQGKPKAFVALIRDVTERKLAEEELAKTMSNLQRFNRLAVGRELQMIELKREVNDLLRSMGRQEKYGTPASEDVENEAGGQNGRER